MTTLYKIGSRGEMVKQIQKALHLLPDGIYGIMTRDAVAQFQIDNGLKADGIVGPATLAKLGIVVLKQNFSLRKSNRPINEIIVHCTATPEGREVSMDELRRWHKQRGFSDVGYHYVVHLNGDVENGRSVDIVGAHCTGHNAQSIGVCYVGGVAKDGKTPKDTRTQQQKAALLSLLMDLKAMYTGVRIYGHRDFANKACPCFDATSEYKRL